MKVNLKYCIWAKNDIRLLSNDRLLYGKGQIIDMGVIYGFDNIESATEEARMLYAKYKGQTIEIWWLKDGIPWPKREAILKKYTNHEILLKRQRKRKPYGSK